MRRIAPGAQSAAAPGGGTHSMLPTDSPRSCTHGANTSPSTRLASPISNSASCCSCCQLPVQPHAGAPQPAETAAQAGVFAREKPLLDTVDLGADPVRHPVHRIGHLVDDLLQKCRDVLNAMAAFQHPARRIDGAKRLVASADQQSLGHREPKESGLLGRIIDIANQIGKYPVQAVIDGVQLLIIIL